MLKPMQIENLVKILKSLADFNRLRIVMAIGNGSLSVSEIIHATDLPQTLVSFHLKALRNAAVVTTKRNGPFIYYSLSSPRLIDILGDLSKTNDTAAISCDSHLKTGSNKKAKTI
jgi:DNA-binding transcriptional ArsR family regulator